jgi:hypothetical protein
LEHLEDALDLPQVECLQARWHESEQEEQRWMLTSSRSSVLEAGTGAALGRPLETLSWSLCMKLSVASVSRYPAVCVGRTIGIGGIGGLVQLSAPSAEFGSGGPGGAEEPEAGMRADIDERREGWTGQARPRAAAGVRVGVRARLVGGRNAGGGERRGRGNGKGAGGGDGRTPPGRQAPPLDPGCGRAANRCRVPAEIGLECKILNFVHFKQVRSAQNEMSNNLTTRYN